MPEAPAGWYVDPEEPARLRWWDGHSWTSSFAPRSPVAPPLEAHPGRGKRIIIAATAGILGLLGLMTSGIGGMLVMVALVGLGVAVVALIKGSSRSLRIRTRGAAGVVLATSFAVLIVGGAIAPRQQPAANVAQLTDTGSAQSSAPTAAATATPHPDIEIEEVITTAAIPFASTTVDDPTLAAGTTVVTVVGVPGVRTTTWSITYTDGRETHRVKVSEVETTPPVTQVTAVGSYVAPPPVAVAPSGCDPNYSGACVPIASDVDCAGGSGNGPAYTTGPVYVVGADIYDLDRDGDGIACDR